MSTLLLLVGLFLVIGVGGVVLVILVKTAWMMFTDSGRKAVEYERRLR